MDIPKRRWQADKAISALQFCHWLRGKLPSWNERAFPRDASGTKLTTTFLYRFYEIAPYLEVLQGELPYRVDVLCTYLWNRMDWIIERGMAPSEQEPFVALTVFIRPVEGGSHLAIETDAERGIDLEAFVVELDQWPDIAGQQEGWKPSQLQAPPNSEGIGDVGESDGGTPAQEEEIYIPKRKNELDAWCATWRAIKGEYEGGNTKLDDLLGFLAEEKNSKIRGWSTSSLSRIITAGRAGVLDKICNS